MTTPIGPLLPTPFAYNVLICEDEVPIQIEFTQQGRDGPHSWTIEPIGKSSHHWRSVPA